MVGSDLKIGVKLRNSVNFEEKSSDFADFLTFFKQKFRRFSPPMVKFFEKIQIKRIYFICERMQTKTLMKYRPYYRSLLI